MCKGFCLSSFSVVKNVLLKYLNILCQVGICEIIFCFGYCRRRLVIAYNLVVELTYFLIQLPKIRLKRFSSKSFQRSKANSLRCTLAGILQAIIAASIRKVPLPHIGSRKSHCPCQPLISNMPAANTSLIGCYISSCTITALMERSS